MDLQISCINKTYRQDPHDRIHSVGNVIVAVHNGNKYIKTENDGLHPNNLLALPECP